MARKSRQVVVDSRTVGQAFGCVGVVLDAKTRRKLAESEVVFPYGFHAAALDDAKELAKERGWTVVAESER